MEEALQTHTIMSPFMYDWLFKLGLHYWKYWNQQHTVGYGLYEM